MWVFGLDVMRRALDDRCNLGYLPRQPSVEGALTGRLNVIGFARLYDVPSRQRREERIEEALATMGLTEVADRVVSTYSGGRVRRLELAQALVNYPSLPTLGLRGRGPGPESPPSVAGPETPGADRSGWGLTAPEDRRIVES